MVIQDLKPSKHIPGRWLVMLEDGSILRVGENEVLDYALYRGKELTPEEGEALAASTRRSGLKEKAMGLLSRKPVSRRELERKLAEWEASEEESGEICDRLEELGFLDDRRYAAQVVAHYAAKSYGPRKLRDELYRRGVPRELWEEAMEGRSDNAEAIDAFLEKKLKGSTDPKDLKKASDALARRGYGWSEIREGLNRLGAEIQPEDSF